MTGLYFTVIGLPAPQGSKRAFVHNGRAHLVESAGDKVKSWRQDVIVAARTEADAMAWETMLGPLRVVITFYLPRPQGHYGTGRNVNTIKTSAPRFPASRPDIDKLTRATLDALTVAAVYKDDSQITALHVRKRYADDRPPGASVGIWKDTGE